VEVHLDQHVQRRREIRALLREPPCDPCAVDRMDPVKPLRDEARLVALDASDEMPDDVELRERIEFRLGFLRIALAEMALSGPICELNRLRGLLFADCDDRHVFGTSACALRRNANTFAYRRQMLR